MKKVVIAVIAVLVLLPIVPKLLPEPITFDRIEAAFKQEGLNMTDVVKNGPVELGAVEQVSMRINGDRVEIYRFDDRGKLAAQLEYQKQDAGSSMVEAWNLSESLGAAKSPNKPVSAVKNGMFMLTITSEDRLLRERVTRIFSSL